MLSFPSPSHSMVSSLLSLHAYSNEALFVLRLILGIIFVYHGLPKRKHGLSFMGFIGLAELIGGIALIAGFLTQLAALGIGIIMLGAIYKKKMEWKVPFSSMDKMGWEYDLLILGTCILLFIMGAGSIAVDPIWFGL